MKHYTVRQLARLSGVSVRTLHHYDACGLLKPASVGENRYRYYGEPQLLRLQQILLHRTLGLSLRHIGALLDAESGSRLATLRRQREIAAAALTQQQHILRTLDRTIAWLEGEQDMPTGKELFEGLSSPEQAAREDWLVGRLGPSTRDGINASRRHLAAQGREGLRARIAELDDVESQLAAYCADGTDVASPQLDTLLARHRAWVGSMWGRDCAPARYAGLADLYIEHPDFVARYEARQPGFAAWLSGAMKQHAGRLGA